MIREIKNWKYSDYGAIDSSHRTIQIILQPWFYIAFRNIKTK